MKPKGPVDHRLSVHHVGGRAGTRSFPVNSRFEGDVVNVLYEADPDCVEQIKERNRGNASELHVLPHCIADSCRTLTFRLNHDPYTSSIYELNPEYAGCYRFSKEYDYVYGEAMTLVEKRQVAAVSLDHLMGSKDSPVPAPDFLSIDVEGAEHDLLLGAKETLASSVLALNVECEFHRVHKDQKLFGDLVDLLSSQGFHFVKLTHQIPFSLYRSPVGLRGDGFLIAGEALFLRKIDTLDDRAKLRKLAFISILFDQFEYGLECLRRAALLPGSTEDGTVYGKFLTELEKAVERAPKAYPDTFGDRYTVDQSFARFAASAADGAVGVGRAKAALKALPVVGPALSASRGFLRSLSRGLKAAPWRRLAFFKGRTEVESLLVRYGLVRQAELLRANRLSQSASLTKPSRNGGRP